jgi:uncharacterized protein YdcH (DUF465 family)
MSVIQTFDDQVIVDAVEASLAPTIRTNGSGTKEQSLRASFHDEINRLVAETRKSEERVLDRFNKLDQRITQLEKLIG